MFLKPPPEIVSAPTARLASSTMLLLALALLAPFVLYFGTAKSIVAIWNSSETFAHGYVILPISLWLIWRRRAVFDVLAPKPWWPGIALLALAGAGWLLARMGEVQVVQQYAFVAMLPLTALALLGPRLAGALAFPLAFLLLAVPFGEVFIAPLISFTADFTVWALQLTGIPVLRNGTHFEIPSGSWSVVEACSGVRYLISSITIGCLYAYLTYRSTTRRALFIAISVVVPIIANGMRAYMIVMIGHLSGMTLATGVDHLIYGWLFFGLVMFVMFWIGSYWREDELAAPLPVAAPSAGLAGASQPRIAAAVIATLALAALWPAFAAFNQRATFNPKPAILDKVDVSWAPAPAFSSWMPRFMPPDAGYNGVFRPAPEIAAAPVALTIFYYRNQDNAKGLISSVNRLAGEKDAYHEVRSALRAETLGRRPLMLRETTMAGADGPLLVWQFMWVDQQYTANNYAGKLMQAQAKLRFRSDDGAAVLLAAPYTEQPELARAALRAFLNTQGDAIDAALATTRRN